MVISSNRYELIDFIRGVAIGLMLIFHFCFGLSYIGLLKNNFTVDLFWLSFRSVIVFLFLSLVGIGLVLATRKKLNINSYLKRLAFLLLYLSLISWLSYQVLPERYVFFGILHLIFVSSILGLFFVKFYWFNLFLGITILLVGNFVSSKLFDQPQLQWVGLMTSPPMTNDYVPLLPWFGLVLIGMFMGNLLISSPKIMQKLTWQATHWISKSITWAGRYCLHIYFIHFQLFYVLIYFFG